MKKLTLILFVLFFLFASQSFACGEDVTKATAKIDNVEYDTQSNTYLANTMRDASGGFWVVQLDSGNVTSIDNAATLTERFKAKYIDIYYVGSLDNDDIEIVDSIIYNPE